MVGGTCRRLDRTELLNSESPYPVGGGEGGTDQGQSRHDSSGNGHRKKAQTFKRPSGGARGGEDRRQDRGAETETETRKHRQRGSEGPSS